MKKLITILFVVIIFIIWANFLVENYLNNSEKNNNLEKKETNILKEVEENKNFNNKKEKKQEEISKEKVDNKLVLLRKRYILRWLIQKGDTYLENEQHLLALKSYLWAIKQTPDDKLITKKIGDTYYEMKKFKIAYTYYRDLLQTEIIDSKKLAITYFHILPKEKKDLDFNKIYKEIDKFNLDKEDSFFYKTSIECIFNKDTCQKKFEDYTKNYKWKNKNILFMKKAFNDYNALQIKEQYFKDTQILAAIFKAKLYWISNILAKDILKEKTDYLPILKIIAKWNYELWKYKDAKKYLLDFNKINKEKLNSDDPKVNYMLWVINIKLHEYILSNIYFIKALKSGYENKSDISRRLIYNYYLSWDNEKMLSEFKALIENSTNINSTDYSLGIYYSIISWKNIQANKWTNKAMLLFPKNDNFYGYKWWIHKEAWDLEKAESYLLKWFKINAHNPLINLNLWIIENTKWNFVKAKIYLKNTLSEDPNWEFWKFATKKLEEIFLEQESLKNQVEENLDDF